ncbi:hypothetical protein H4R24_001292 [Coemansia sp. RSA 988]|nr:hypothetical protein H4R24_001292 [Coemansia sp. RSA 988]
MFPSASYPQGPSNGDMNLGHAHMPSGYMPHIMPKGAHNIVHYHPNQAYNGSRVFHGAPSCSPECSYYSSDTSLMSGATLGRYATDELKSPSPTSSNTASPPLQAAKTTTAAIRTPKKRGPQPKVSAEEREKRRKTLHSEIEKKRRVRTNKVMESLRKIIPDLMKQPKAEKLAILEGALKYITKLLPNDTDAEEAAEEATEACAEACAVENAEPNAEAGTKVDAEDSNVARIHPMDLRSILS